MEVFAGPEQDYLVTVEQLEAALTDRTKILLFVSPSNPTGSVYSPEQVAEIGKWAASKGLWVVTDEIYEHLTYDGVPFTSIATAAPELGDKVVILNGVAKTYAMTGWRVGWMIGPGRRHQGRHQPAVARDLQRLQHPADRRPRRRLRPADRRRRDEGRLRPPPQGDRRRPERHRRR